MKKHGESVFNWVFSANEYKSLDSEEVYQMLRKHAHRPALGKQWGAARSMALDGPKNGKMPDLTEETQYLQIFSRRALDSLLQLIPRSAQQLKIECGDYDYWALNVLWTKDALVTDESECRISGDGDVTSVKKGVFRRDAIEGEIFTVPRCLEVYVTGKFLNAVEEHGLKGLVTDLEPVGRLV